MTDVIDQATAEQEFERFCDEMDVDTDESIMTDADINAFYKTRNRVIRGIQRGTVVINEAGEAIYALQKTDLGSITHVHFHERTTGTVTAMDKRKRHEDGSRAIAMMAHVTRLHPSQITKLKNVDGKTCEAIFALLMD